MVSRVNFSVGFPPTLALAMDCAKPFELPLLLRIAPIAARGSINVRVVTLNACEPDITTEFLERNIKGRWS
jgi:hypothetical protein